MRSRLLPVIAVCALIAGIDAPKAFAQGAAASSSIAIGVFTLSRAFAESTDGKAAIERVKAVEDRHAAVLQEKEKAMQSLEQSLQPGATALSDTERAQKTRDLERAKVEMQRLVQDAEAELGAVQREVEGAFLEKLKPALERVAKARGVQIVVNFDDGGLLWNDPSLDLTDALIRELEPEFGARPNVLPFVPALPAQ